MKNLIANWEKTLELLKPELTAVSYDTWVYPLTPVKIDHKENRLYLSLYNDMAKSILEGRYISIIENAVKEAFGKKLKVIFIYTEDPQVNQDDINFTDELYLNPKYIFNTFVIGNNNRFAHAASLAVAESPSKAYNPLFIYGGAGLGKTHLMHAIGHYILQQNPKTKVLYVSSEMFTNELIKAIREDKNMEFRNKYRSIDVLLIDDIQFIAGKESTQEEFFHTFNDLHENNKQIILSSDKPPKEIAKLEERLQSRFEGGLIADVQPPNYETKLAILMKKARDIATRDGLKCEIGQDILDLIASKVSSNIRSLEGALNKIIAYTVLNGRSPNLVEAEIAIRDFLTASSNKKVTSRQILQTVCEYYELSEDEISSNKKNQNVAYPRQIAMYLTRKLMDMSYKSIAEIYGKSDHTTVKHAYEKIERELSTSMETRTLVDDFITKLRE